MSRRQVYDATNELARKIQRLKDAKDREDFGQIHSDLVNGIRGWEIDVKYMAGVFGVRNLQFPGDMIGLPDDDVRTDLGDDDEEADEEENKKKP